MLQYQDNLLLTKRQIYTSMEQNKESLETETHIHVQLIFDIGAKAIE